MVPGGDEGGIALIRIGQVLTVPGATATVGNTFAGRTYADDVVAAANANLETLRATGVPSKSDMQTLIITTATQMGVDPADCLALEDSHNGVRSASSAGMMTVMVPDMLDPTEEMHSLCVRIARDLHEVRELLAAQPAG